MTQEAMEVIPAEAGTEPVNQPTKDELIAQMQEAINSGNFKAVSQISSKINKLAVAEEKTELEAKQALVAEKTSEVLDAINKTVNKLVDAGKLDNADGVWYAWDFDETLKTCRLLKKTVKVRTAGVGVGKRFAITTDQLLEKHGTEVEPKSGVTYQELWNANTDKNSRFQIRTKLLKLNGDLS